MRSLSAKRALDLAGSVFLLLALAPVLVTAWAAVALTSPGGALVRLPRAGLRGEPFPLLRFRTGRAEVGTRAGTGPGTGGSAGEGAGEGADTSADTGADAGAGRPALGRRTPVGRLLRRLSLDGLPQLVNVVRGEMSLVGPRPHPLPMGDPGPTGLARGRLAVRPGMTGLWQVGVRSGLPWDEMLLVDLEYVDTHCLAVDLAILARTVPASLTARKAGRRARRTGGRGEHGSELHA